MIVRSYLCKVGMKYFPGELGIQNYNANKLIDKGNTSSELSFNFGNISKYFGQVLTIIYCYTSATYMSINYFTDIGNHLDLNSKYPTKTNLAFESFSNAFLINSVISVTFTTAILEHLRTCNERILLQYPQKGLINSTVFFLCATLVL